MTLCSLCKTIPPKFFSSARNDQCTVEHHPNLVALEKSVEAGCRMCAIVYNAIQRRVKDGKIYSTMDGKPVDLSQQINLRSTKFGAQSVCLGWADVGSMRGIEVPHDWDDVTVYDCKPELGMASDLKYQSDTVRWWLENCWGKHAECRKNHDASYLPTRLIDVESSDPNLVRLVVTAQESIDDPRYIASSHCWGLNMPELAKTVTSNFNKHTESIPLSDLSRTFIDFIRISRDIGVRYVWIDSLCIIQDSYEDWTVEAAQMAAVYSNAYVTVAASSSSDGTGGCRKGDASDSFFGPADLKWDEEDESGNRKTRTIRVFAKPEGHAVTSLSQDPLVSRGWTLQERELSPRVVHYSKDTIRWECACQKATLEFPWSDSLSFNNALRAFDQGQLQPQGTEGWYSDEAVRKNSFVWFEVVERYTKRSLTKQTDILPAVSGIARYFSKEIGDKYHAGLFESHGVIALIWRIAAKSKDKRSRHSEYLAPTWSWASVKGPAEWWWTLKQHKPEPVGHTFTPQILEMSTVPAGDDPFSILKGGTLRLKGLLVPVGAMWREQDRLEHDQRSIIAIQADGQMTKVGTITFDIPEEACQVLFCFACRRESQFGWIDALGLTQTGQGTLQFKRVGLVRSKEKSWWEKAVTAEISII
ncbi:hypothetical protein NW755_007475 [Fusarium falciforme]|uniref:Heterokaryon incompatibility domain-containing protein n=1 Tax=Fusarium falciforme TaxID=195108 RepID=A0A9W8R5D9_9HYPO|nr:hypothetical protein NW755_007475 [Fusarium falciforme]